MEQLHYAAFISYRHKEPDEIIARRLHKQIENYHIPANIQNKLGIKKVGRVFRDQEELPLSKDLGGDIREALDHSDWLIVLCSPDYLQSKWCNAELDYFIEIGKRDHILAVLVNGEPNEAFPDQLRYQMIDGQMREVEPLAGDVRGESVSQSLKKLEDEKLRILAPMLDVNYDQLKQRQRRRQMTIAITVVSICFLLLTSFLTYAIHKNNQITAQRNIAIDNQMQLLIEQANMDSGQGNKLAALEQLLEAAEVRKDVGEKNDTMFAAALEYALYNSPFEPVLSIDSDNRQFDQLVFSHDDHYLLGITNLNSACLIDATTGKLLFTVSRSNTGQLDSVGFTADDHYFYMVDSWFGFVSLYSVEDGSLYREYDGSGQYTWNIADKVFAMQDQKLLIVKRKVLVIWDYVANTTQEILPCGDGMFEEYIQPLIVDLSPDEKSIVVGSHGYGIGMKILTLDGSSQIQLDFDQQRGYPRIMYSKDGRMIAACSGSRYYLWNAADGKLLLEGDNEAVGSVDDIMINHDASVLLLMSSNYLKAIDCNSGQTLWLKENESNIMTETYLSPDGRYVGCTGGIEGVYDIHTGELIYAGAVSEFSNDSSKVITDTYTSSPRLLVTPLYATSTYETHFSDTLFYTPRFTAPSQQISVTLAHNCPEIYSENPEMSGRQSNTYTSTDLKYAAFTHYDGFVEAFDISNPNQVVEIGYIAEHCFNSVTDLVFNGDLMASCGGYDPRCVLYDLAKQQIRYVLPGIEYAHGLEFSSDGSKLILLCGYNLDSAYVYSTLTGNLLYEFHTDEEHYIKQIGFSSDGTKVVAVLDNDDALTGILYPNIDAMLLEAAER